MSFHAQRRERLKKKLAKLGADCCLITNVKNVTYLTGFTGDSTYLLLGKTDRLLSDTRYTEQLQEECGDLEAEIRDSRVSMMEMLGKVVRSCKCSGIAFEADSVSYSVYQSLTDALPAVSLVPTSGVVEELREIKDKQELAEIRRSIAMAEKTFQVIRASLTANQTEREVAHNLEHQIRQFGGTECAFEPIVAVGSRAALPHAVPTERKIGESSFVLFDWGAKAGLYTSDLTRIVVTQKPPAKLEKIYNVVLEAQLAAIDKIRPGVSSKEVDAAARDHIAGCGYGKRFGHGLGHGFGLEIHENPRMSPMSEKELKAGMVITVEPGIYLPGWGGVRIEDDILVTKDGHEVLTSVPKDFADCHVTL